MGLLASGLTEAEPQKLLRGFSYHHDDIQEGPWSVHVVKIDRTNPNVQLQTLLPPGGRFGLVKLSEQVKALKPEFGLPLAAINGDYYEDHSPYTGDPQGLQIMRGELISGPCDWTCFWIDAAGKPNMATVENRFEATLPNGSKLNFGLNEKRRDDDTVLYTTAVGSRTHTRGGVELALERSGDNPWLPLRPSEIYTARVAEVSSGGDTKTATNRLILSIGPKLKDKISLPAVGETVRISTATSPSLKGASMAIGGGPAIVRKQKVITRNEARVRHPRSAIAWNDRFIYLVEVDGRQPDLSVGMTFEELSEYLVKLGCQEAMSLDGGGSATMWVRGQVMNNPCEGGERGMANGLVLVLKKDQGKRSLLRAVKFEEAIEDNREG